MKPFIELDDYENSIFRLFGRFPLLLMILTCLAAYTIGILMHYVGFGGMEDPIGLEGFSNGFFRGVVAAVGLFYIGRISAVSSLKSAAGLTSREQEGTYIPCMSHSKMMDLSYGSIVILPDRLYFESNRPFGGDRTFDYRYYDGFKFALSQPKESIGLFLVTGERYMLTVEDADGKRVGTFIIPEPEAHLAAIQELI